ncbi:MAG: OmpA family protein [Thiomargarita sp.]|nr:OmpA family protein [Bacteroidales bacterium]MCK5718432.1 OmpA family protein [Thiomargarita sp.]
MKLIIYCFMLFFLGGCQSIPIAGNLFGSTEKTSEEPDIYFPPPIHSSTMHKNVAKEDNDKTTAAVTVCKSYKREVQQAQAVDSENLETLADLMRSEKRYDCYSNSNDLTQIDYALSEMSNRKASSLIGQGKLKDAKQLLLNSNRYFPIGLWATEELKAKIYAKEKDWGKATLAYNKAFTLTQGKKVRPPVSDDDRKRLYRLTSETQLLAGTISSSTITRSGSGSGIMNKDSMRGIGIIEHPIPIQFIFGKTEFNQNGKESADKLAGFFKKQQIKKQITLIGHTDQVGNDYDNCMLSRGRALELKNHLISKGIIVAIKAVGKGKRQPFELYDPSEYTQDEIDQMNRRVEFALDHNVSIGNICQ